MDTLETSPQEEKKTAITDTSFIVKIAAEMCKKDKNLLTKKLSPEVEEQLALMDTTTAICVRVMFSIIIKSLEVLVEAHNKDGLDLTPFGLTMPVEELQAFVQSPVLQTQYKELSRS